MKWKGDIKPIGIKNRNYFCRLKKGENTLF
jgi:hypothetical protein